jgi:hypothetical protein
MKTPDWMKAPAWIKPGARIRARWRIASVIPEGALGRVESVDERGYVKVVWDDKTVQENVPRFMVSRGIHFEHLKK